MPAPTWSSSKAKVQLRLSVQRLRTVQQKKEAQAKSSRRDIALLLEKGKIESARIKTEASINEDINLEFLELMELYCELLNTRFGLLDQNTREPDPGIKEGVCAIIYAGQRTEVKELNVMRELLMQKYGREFSAAAMDNRGGCVSDRVVKKLVVETPSTQLVDGYLTEIAKAYGVKWTASTPQAVVTEEGKTHQSPTTEEIPESLPSYSAESSSAPRLPDLPPTEDEAEKSAKKPSSSSPTAKEGSEDDFESIAQRFQALKKR